MTPTNATIAGPKKPAVVTATTKLSNRETDWKLAGNTTPVTSRTCGGGSGRPTFSSRKKLFNEPETTSESESSLESDEEAQEEEDLLERVEDEETEDIDFPIIEDGGKNRQPLVPFLKLKDWCI